MQVTDEYSPEEDNPSFNELVEAGVVLDSTGQLEQLHSEQLPNPRYPTIVPSGYGYHDVWKSNLQKAIRRGDETSALKSLVEVAELSLVPGGLPSFGSNILNRAFQVIVSEDIGWAEPFLPSYVEPLLTAYYADRCLLREKWFQEKILRGIQVLVRCHKSRYVDYLYHYACLHPKNGSTPDLLEQLKAAQVSLEEKVVALVTLSRSLEQVKLPPTSDPRLCRRRKVVFLAWQYLLGASPYRGIRRQVSALLNLYLLPGGESTLNLIHALVLVESGTRLVCSTLPVIEATPSWEEIKTWGEFPLAVAYDQHTLIGRLLNRGEAWFDRYGGKITRVVPKYRVVELAMLNQLQPSPN